MSSHRESRFDEPPEPDRPIPQSGDADADTSKLWPDAPIDAADAAYRTPDVVTELSAEIDEFQSAEPMSDWSVVLSGRLARDVAAGDETAAGSGERSEDCFAPPDEPCQCHCLHCGRTFSSSEIWFQKVINDPQGFPGFWMCPTPNCSGSGFTFDIFPTDPAHPANEGWHDDDLDGEDEDDDFADDDSDGESSFDASDDSAAIDFSSDEDPVESEYDPAEPQYAEMDDFYGDGDDDMEGEEWKYGLEPGERPAEPAWREEARREWEEDQQRYDEPDQRPRVLDWSNRTDRLDENRTPFDGKFSDDDIPF